MKIREVLSPNAIIDVRASDKTCLLRHLSAQAASELGLDPDEAANLLLSADHQSCMTRLEDEKRDGALGFAEQVGSLASCWRCA